ncbi:unnamed protein product [Prorocentrum cordatum]|uniref:SET domain-containing protein n=1 Tax=Prorocentrum cordatum TaxID=2364126 RepID=A0ABN9RMJ4_9DINO|nr:unnamed protein product [Polarella glacialis]
MTQSARNRRGAGASDAASSKAGASTGGTSRKEGRAAGSTSGMAAWALPLLSGLVGLSVAEALRKPGGLFGMPLAALISGYAYGPVGGDLERWLWQHGGWPNAYVAPVANGGRGLVAAFDLSPGDQVLYVPKHLHLRLPGSWERRARIPGESEGDAKNDGESHALGSLSQRLLEEGRMMNESKWGPYLRRVLQPADGPPTFNLLMWPREAANLGRMLVPHYVRKLDTALLQSDSVEFRSSLRHTTSRFHGGNVTMGDIYVVPMVDFINHATPKEAKAKVKIAGTSGMVVEALSHISAGEEVTITYGELPNAHLLVAYGFSLAQNGMGSQVFFVDPLSDGGDSDCKWLLQHLAPEGNLYLSDMNSQVSEEGWASCLRGVQVQEDPDHGQKRYPVPLGEACRSRAASILAALEDVAQVLERQVWTPHEASVLGQLQEVAGTELRAIQLCAGDART